MQKQNQTLQRTLMTLKNQQQRKAARQIWIMTIRRNSETACLDLISEYYENDLLQIFTFMNQEQMIDTIKKNPYGINIEFDLFKQVNPKQKISSRQNSLEQSNTSYQKQLRQSKKQTQCFKINSKFLNSQAIEPFAVDQIVTIQPDDHRRIIRNTKNFPYSAVGQLYIILGQKNKGFGTCFLIQKNFAVTAAHNLYDRDKKCYILRAIVNFQLQGQSTKTYELVGFEVPNQFRQIKDDYQAKKFDYAVLELKPAQKMQLQTINYLELSFQHHQQDLQIQICGYPLDLSGEQKIKDIWDFKMKKTEYRPQEMYMFSCTNLIKKVEAERIMHGVDTSGGQSGSPILRWNKSTQKQEVIGIHTAGDQKFNQNIGVRITKAVIQRINSWISSFKQRKLITQDAMRAKYNDAHIQYQIEEPVAIQFKKEKFENPDIEQQKLNSLLKYKNLLEKISISIKPDKHCYSISKQLYKLSKSNKNICIRQNDSSDWICSKQILPDGRPIMVTVKVLKVSEKNGHSCIAIGVMENDRKKMNKLQNIGHVVYLDILHQRKVKPVKGKWRASQTQCNLPSLPHNSCQINMIVDRYYNTVQWRYLGKKKEESDLPIQWKNKRTQLCVVVMLFNQGDCVQFM